MCYISIFGHKYSIDTVIILEKNHLPLFARIIDIYECKNNIYFYVKVFETIVLDTYYNAYKVYEHKVVDSQRQLLHIDNILDVHPCLYIKNQDGEFISLRYEI